MVQIKTLVGLANSKTHGGMSIRPQIPIPIGRIQGIRCDQIRIEFSG